MRPLRGKGARRSSTVPAVTVAIVLALGVLACATTAGASRGGGQEQVVLAPPALDAGAASAPGQLQSRPANLTKAARPAALTAPAVVDPVDLKLLVISADGNETDLPYLKAVLGQIGIPFDVLIATQTTLTPELLSDGAAHGYYQGVVLTTGNLTHSTDGGLTWSSAFDDSEWQTLYAYERQFGVRQVTSYTYPAYLPDGDATGAYGLAMDWAQTYVDTATTPLSATLTAAGEQVFPFLNPATPVTFRNAWVYRAFEGRCDAATDCASLTPLLKTDDGHVVAIVKRYLDGRENLAATAANSSFLVHSALLSYGVVNWVTRGLFLGERHVNLDVQVDDTLLADELWDAAAHATGAATYRLSGADFDALVAWQQGWRSTALLSGLTLEHAFNGQGASGVYANDTLTPAVKAGQGAFAWVNHGWQHLDLDTADSATSLDEIQANVRVARQLKLTQFSKDAYVPANIRGLNNPAFLGAAAQLGIRYLVSDASQPGGGNPSPNAGRYSELQPSILVIPRRANNLFYNVLTPEQWVDEYNHYYGPRGVSPFAHWDHDLSYAEILDHESDNLLVFMLRWDLDPWMFHQTNLADYGGGHSLLGDLLDATFAKYASHYRLPVRNLTEHDVGLLMAQRMAYDAAHVRASMTPCANGKTQLTLVADAAATAPVTGATIGKKAETYGGQPISYVALQAGTPLTVRANCRVG